MSINSINRAAFIIDTFRVSVLFIRVKCARDLSLLVGFVLWGYLIGTDICGVVTSGELMWDDEKESIDRGFRFLVCAEEYLDLFI